MVKDRKQPRRALQRVAHTHPQHHGNQSAEYARSDVDRRFGPFTLFEHADRVPAESGKGCESAHQSDGQADAEIGTDSNVVETELPDDAEEKTSQEIDGKGSHWESGAYSILNPTVEPIAGQRPRSAKYN